MLVDELSSQHDWKKMIAESIGDLLGEEDIDRRLKEIRERIERMDVRWDHGFISDEHAYLEQRLQLQQELEQLTPVDNDDLERAVDLLDNFSVYWDDCKGDVELQHQLLTKIVERVYVEDDRIVAVTLKSSCHLVLGHKLNEPTEYTVDPFQSDEFFATSGDDGNRSLRCTSLIRFIARHIQSKLVA
jgi:hypothetical protein